MYISETLHTAHGTVIPNLREPLRDSSCAANESTEKVELTVFRITVSDRWQGLFLAFKGQITTFNSQS